MQVRSKHSALEVKIQSAIRDFCDRRILLKFKWRKRLDPRSWTGTASEKILRRLAIGVLGLVLTGAGFWAAHDIDTRAEQARVERSDLIQDLSRTANILFLAEDARISGMLERLRIELRAQEVWSQPRTLDALGLAGEDPDDVNSRRLHGVLRRGLSANEDVSVFELIVAGHDGLATFRLEQGSTGEASEKMDPRVREGFAKALWYADEVRRSVVSTGRRIERADLAFERIGDAEHPILRVAIGLHEPGELVQGALVASIDMGGFATRLAAISAASGVIDLVMPDGRSLASTSAVGQIDARDATLAARILGEADLPEVFEADGRLVYGLPMAFADGSRANLLVLVETDAPAVGFLAFRESSWPIALAIVLIVSGVALWGLLRPGGRGEVGGKLNAATSTVSGASIGGPAELEIERECFVLRDWLADVRGCLERDAATRGLMLDLRCDRGLPDQLESDPAWLGGLLVAMGREALEATSEERVRLDVVEDVGNTLRFELAAAGASLDPIQGMREVATRIGAHFEQAQEGRVALVLADALTVSERASA